MQYGSPFPLQFSFGTDFLFMLAFLLGFLKGDRNQQLLSFQTVKVPISNLSLKQNYPARFLRKANLAIIVWATRRAQGSVFLIAWAIKAMFGMSFCSILPIEQDLVVARWLMELKDGRKSAFLRLCFIPENILKRKITCKLHLEHVPPQVELVISNFPELADKWNRRRGNNVRNRNAFTNAIKASLSGKNIKKNISSFSVSRSGLSRTVTLRVSRQALEQSA